MKPFRSYNKVEVDIVRLNILFALAGLFAIYLGFEVRSRVDHLNIRKFLASYNVTVNDSLIPFPFSDLNSLEKELYAIPFYTTAFGVILMTVSLFGLIALELQQGPTFIVFSAVLFVFTLVGLFLGIRILSVEHSKEISALEEDNLFQKLMKDFKSNENPYNQTKSYYLEAIQTQLSCCNYTFDSQKPEKLSHLPFSCCTGYDMSEIEKIIQGVKHHTECRNSTPVGRRCKPRFKDILETMQIPGSLTVFVSILVGIMLIQMMLAFFMMGGPEAFFGRESWESNTSKT